LWPGQTIEWKVAEDQSHENAPAAEREWQSQLRLSMPRLGGIDAALTVSSRGVRINLCATSEDSAALLEGNRQSLREGLTKAGVKTLSIGVVHAGS